MQLNTPQTVLINAKALIADPKNWTQGVFARNADGYSTGVHEEDAICFCTLGAIAVAGDNQKWAQQIAINTLSKIITVNASNDAVSVGAFNDTHTHEEVMELFDKAIKEAA
jgi:hypothetical protein